MKYQKPSQKVEKEPNQPVYKLSMKNDKITVFVWPSHIPNSQSLPILNPMLDAVC